MDHRGGCCRRGAGTFAATATGNPVTAPTSVAHAVALGARRLLARGRKGRRTYSVSGSGGFGRRGTHMPSATRNRILPSVPADRQSGTRRSKTHPTFVVVRYPTNVNPSPA